MMLQRAVGALHFQVDVLLHHLVQHEIVRDAGDDPDDAHGLGRWVEADPRVAHDDEAQKRQDEVCEHLAVALLDEGFYHLCGMKGDESEAELSYIIRDHDRENFEKRKRYIQHVTQYLNEKYGDGTVDAVVEDSYYNMKEKILPHMQIVKAAEEAMRKCGIEPVIVPIRGGTDGARLSYMGLPCPNLSTGGHNFHGKYEYIPAESMEVMTNVLVELVKC